LSGKSGPAGSDRSGASGASGDVWLTLGHTASMSPDERARRGLSQPEHGAEPAAAAPLSTPPTPAPESSAPDPHPLDESTRYELEGVHARGGLGRVVRAHDRLLQRTVAIKELLQRTPAAQARFMREALITARLQHPGIVPVHEAGHWPSGDPYYSMKLVSGRTLKELIQARGGLDERLALLPHVLAVAEAIAYAHSQGVIHRDIKPANVIVGDFGETVVVDWGLAKELSAQAQESDEAGSGSLDPDTEPAATAVGHIMGTPAYMAPEQARGDGADARSDVYSLGAMLYELLAGEPPHTGDSADQILRSALTSAPVPIEERQPAAPPDLVAIVHKAMARRAGDRYRSATPLAEDIRRFQTGQLVSARHYSTRTLVRRWIARYRAVVAVAIAAAMALAAGGALWLQRVVGERNMAEARRAQAQQAVSASTAKNNDMIFLQAQSWLSRDPTAALAWLKRYPQDGPRADRLGAMVDEAVELGVARHVLRQPTWVMGVGFTSDGAGLVGVLKTGEVIRWDVGSGADRQIGRISETVKISHVSPDRRTIAVGGAGGAVELFPLGEEAPARRLRGHADEIRWLGFSADSRRLMTGSGDRAVRVWDLVRGGEPLLTIDREPVSGVVLAGGGDAVFIALSSGEIARVEVEGGARRRLARLPQPAYGLTPSPDGRAIAAQSREGAIWLVDATTGAVRPLGLRGGKGNWGFSPTGRYLTAATSDGTIRLHELATGAETVLRGHEDAIYHLVFSADESILLSASDDATARVWDLRTGGVRVLRGHDDDVTYAALSPDGKTAATGSLDSSVRVWQLDGSADLAEIVDGRIGPYVPERWSTLTNDGRMVVSFPAEDTVTLWKLDGGERSEQTFLPVDRLNPRYRHTSSSALERRARLLAVPQPGGRVAVWDLGTGARRMLGRDGREEINALTIARDGSVLVTADAAGTVLVWNLAAGPEVEPRVLLRGRRKSRGAALSPRADRLALALEGRLDLFDMTTGDHLASAELETSAAPSDQPRTLEFSPDGRFVASRSKAASSLVLWNLDRGQARRIDIGGHEVTWLAFSPDSSRLALAVTDRTVRIVATATAQTRLLQGHRDLVLSVAWSPDGRVLASASYDRTVRLWDPENGRVRVLRGHGASVESIAFSPNGTLVSTGADGMVRRWHLDRLPEERAEVVSQRLAAATTAIIGTGAGERAATLPSAQAAAPASGGSGTMPGAAHRPAAGWAPAR
jgi:eukaryotic-like serine/threonine-protein kinase